MTGKNRAIPLKLGEINKYRERFKEKKAEPILAVLGMTYSMPETHYCEAKPLRLWLEKRNEF